MKPFNHFEEIKIGTHITFSYLFEADGFERGLPEVELQGSLIPVDQMDEVSAACDKLIKELYGDVDENDDLVAREIEVGGIVVELENDNDEEEIEMTIKLNKKTYCAGDSCHENNNFRSINAGENFTFALRKVGPNWCVSFCQYHSGEKISKPIMIE